MNIVFMGTSDFACRCLMDILNDGFLKVTGVYIKPETSHGRRKKKSPVKELAVSKNIPVFAPDSLKKDDALKGLRDLKPRVIVVIDYGLILPRSVLDIPESGCINLHASLLPLYRGAAPIQRALLAGDEITGVTLMHMNEKLDEGDIVLQKGIAVESTDDFFSLSLKLSDIGAKMMIDLLKDICAGKTADGIEQDHTQATFAPKVQKSDGVIDWNENADIISRKIRALIKWPGCVSKMKLHGKEKLIKILMAVPCDASLSEEFPPGTVVRVDGTGLCVSAGENTCLRIEKLQIEGKRSISAKDFVNGFQVHQGDRFFW